MKKLFDKDELWFALLWIGIYVLVFSNADALSEAIGIPKLLTVIVGFALSWVLFRFIRAHALQSYFGLCPVTGKPGGFLWFLPLAVISSVNFWNGLAWSLSPAETVLYILSMCCVGFLEEVIFRGLLFKAMYRSNVTAAIIVSSVTFGMGHIVNLLLGEPLFDTALQLVYASAVGFCYTAIFHTTGSILPCILSHILVNATSVFAREPSQRGHLVIALVQSVLGISYGLWLLYRHKNRKA